MLTGSDLIASIDNTEVPLEKAAFWWLGQHSFIVKTANHILYLDPFLTPMENRQIPPLLQPEDIVHADVITGSHDHADHIDHPSLPAIMQASPQATLLVPAAARAAVGETLLSRDRVSLMEAETTWASDGITITSIPAAHELIIVNDEGLHEHLSYIIETDGVTIYHAGDTCMYEGMISRLLEWDFTIAFLPINGRDAERLKRGCIGNMTYQEAADLAGALQPQLTVPAHFDMFIGNQEDPQLFTDYMQVKYPDLKCIVPKHGEKEII